MNDSADGRAETYEQQVSRYVAFADAQVPDLLSPRRAAALERMGQAHTALHEALRWLIEQDEVVPAARMIRALRSYWQERGLVTEGQEWTAKALAMPSAAALTDARATLLDQAAVLAVSAGDLTTARTLAEEALAIRSQPGMDALLPNMLAHLALIIREADHDYERARSLLEQAVRLGRERGNTYIHRSALYRLAQVAIDQHDISRARDALEENVAVARATGDEWALGLVLGVFGVLAAQEGDPVRALRLAGAGAANRPGIGFGGKEQAWLDRLLAPARQALDADAQAAAWAQGQGMPLQQALDDALSDPTRPLGQPREPPSSRYASAPACP
ncbi:MAG: hypothetical protein ACRDI2_01765 [Chloroflexota bacterium]